MIEKHYKSDFKVFVSLPDKLTLAPFKFTYFIEGNRTKYVVSYDGHSYYNCSPLEDGRLLIIFQNHNLGIGTINVIRQYFLPDEDFASGVCRTFSEESTDIYLGEGYSDEGDVHVQLPPDYMQGKPGKSAYQEWLDMGNSGSIYDFVNSLRGESFSYSDMTETQKTDLASYIKVNDGSITEVKLANNSVSTEKIKDGAVTMAKLGSDVKKALKDAEIADGSITEDKLSEEVREKLNQGGGGGEKGEDGKSAYEIWLEQGNKGSEQDFLDSLKGEKGEQGIQGDKGDKMTYDDLSEEDKNDLASRVEVEVPTKTSELTNDSGYVTATKVVAQSASTATIQPNVLNVWGEVESLDITLAEPTDNTIVNEYMAQFTSGATATTLTLPNTIKWMAAPNIQPNKTYQLSIINNLGVIGEFSHE